MADFHHQNSAAIDRQPAYAATHGSHGALLWLLLAQLLALAGCSTIGDVMGKALGMEKTAQAASRSESPPSAPVAFLQVRATPDANSGSGGKGLTTIVKVYQLRAIGRFQQATYESFLDEAAERSALGEDLERSAEVVLLPGQTADVTEQLSASTTYIGIVALLHSPTPNRWKLVLDAAQAAHASVSVDVHACTITLTKTAELKTPPDSSVERCTRR